MLIANKKYIDTSSIAHLLINGEKNVDTIKIQVDRFYHGVDLSQCDYILRAVNENQNLIDQTLSKAVDDENVVLTWTINEYFTAVDGKLLLEIRAVRGEELILKYVMSPIYVKSSATGEGLPSLDTVEKALDDMQKLLDNAQNIAVRVPYIQDGTWWVWNVSQNQYVDTGTSAQGEKGQDGANGRDGVDGINGLDGKDGADGKDGTDGLSAYEVWVSQGNVGTEVDFLNSLKGAKGDKGDQGEQGLQGIQGVQGERGEKGEKGDTGEKGQDGNDGINGVDGQNGKDGTDGKDGLSPTVTVAESTSSSYVLAITDVNGTFNTPNLKGQDGSGTSITVDDTLSIVSENPVQNKVISTQIRAINSKVSGLEDDISNLNFNIVVDSELSETSENPVQNKAITSQFETVSSTLSVVESEIVKLNDIIKSLPTGSDTVTTTLFDYSSYTNFWDSFKFKDNQWSDSEYTLEEAVQKVSSLCSSEYDYQLRLSSMFGWSATVQILCLIPVEIDASSRLLINYTCSTTGSNIAVDILPTADFSAESVGTFEDIPSIYIDGNSYISLNLFQNDGVKNGTYYLKFTYTSTNPVFLIKSIEVIT